MLTLIVTSLNSNEYSSLWIFSCISPSPWIQLFLSCYIANEVIECIPWMLIDKVSPVCEIVFNFIQFPFPAAAFPFLASPAPSWRDPEKITWYCFLGNSVQGFPTTFPTYPQYSKHTFFNPTKISLVKHRSSKKLESVEETHKNS